MRTIDEALALVLARAPGPVATESVSAQDAVGRVLADDVVSACAEPPFARATMDGFALAAADASSAGATLRVRGESAAGRPMDGALQRGHAARIFTGAPVPDGADAVVMVERTELQGEHVRLLEPVVAGQNITPAGEYLAAGALAVARGSEISTGHVGVLLSLGAVVVRVHARPRVAILASGSELVDPAAVPGPGCIRESNGGMLAALVRQAGCEPVVLGRIGDDRAAIGAAARSGLAHDALLLTGGSSVGDYDFTPAVLNDIGVDVHFDRVAMKPGKPTIFGTRADRVVFGLPGNPVSAFVAFHLFVRPALKRRLGVGEAGPRWIAATLEHAVPRTRARDQVLPARLFLVDGALRVEFHGWRGSGDVTCLRDANALVRLKAGDAAGDGPVAAGARVLVTPIDGGRAGDVALGFAPRGPAAP